MLTEIIGLVLWTGIIFTFCFLNHRRKVQRDNILVDIRNDLQIIADKVRDLDGDN